MTFRAIPVPAQVSATYRAIMSSQPMTTRTGVFVEDWATVDRKSVNELYKYFEYGPRSKARRHKHVKALHAEVLKLLGENLEGMHVGPLTQLAQAAVPGHPNGLVRAVLLDMQYTGELKVEWPKGLYAPLYKLSFEAWVQNIEVKS